MKTIPIEKRNWSRFVKDFNDLHETAIATVQVFRHDSGAQTLVSELPLIGIDFDARSGNFQIVTGRNEERITHSVAAVTKVWLEQTDPGADVAVELDAADGTTTLLRLKSPVLSELLAAGVE